MSKDIVMQKRPDGSLVATDAMAHEYIQKLPVGKMLGVTVTQARNYKFHRKIFALLGYLYDRLPKAKAKYKGQSIEQSFNTFRREQVALCGFYHADATMQGTIRIEPQGINFNDCSEELAQEIYSALIDRALLILTDGQSSEELDAMVDEILRFDS